MNEQMCVDCDERPVTTYRADRVCNRCYQRRWRAENPDYMAEASRKYRSDPENRQRDRERSLRWKHQNLERKRAYDREYKRRRRVEAREAA